MIEIFSHGISVKPDPDAEGILVVAGFGWENEPFNLYLNEEAAADLLWQLNFYVGSER